MVRIKCIVTYDLNGLISHKRKTITLDVLKTWSHYILNYGDINIMAKKPRLEVFSRLHIIQTVNKIFDYILSCIACRPRHVIVPSSVSKSFLYYWKTTRFDFCLEVQRTYEYKEYEIWIHQQKISIKSSILPRQMPLFRCIWFLWEIIVRLLYIIYIHG